VLVVASTVALASTAEDAQGGANHPEPEERWCCDVEEGQEGATKGEGKEGKGAVWFGRGGHYKLSSVFCCIALVPWIQGLVAMQR
jgi:hypothetical protein